MWLLMIQGSHLYVQLNDTGGRIFMWLLMIQGVHLHVAFDDGTGGCIFMLFWWLVLCFCMF
jgi:hypothetical protein